MSPSRRSSSTPCFSRAQPCLREHPPRRVNPDHKPARCLSDRDRNSPGTNGKLDQWPVSLKGKPDVERNVSADATRRLRVSVRPSVVPTRHRNTIFAKMRRLPAAPVCGNVPRGLVAGGVGHQRVGVAEQYEQRERTNDDAGTVARRLRRGIIKELTHRAGINADILVGGVIRVGDPVVEL